MLVKSELRAKRRKMKKQMRRKVWKPDYDGLAGYLREDMPTEIKIKFIQSLLRVDSLEEAVLKLVKTKEQPKRLLEFLQRNLDDGGN